MGHSISLSLAVLGRLRPAASTIEALIGLSVALVAVEAASQCRGEAPARTSRERPVGGRGSAPLLFAGAAVLVGLLASRAGRVSAEAVVGVALMSGCVFALGPRGNTSAERLRLCITALFGLIHGFGFATVLGRLRLGPGQLGAALLGFNLGVEIGQIVLLAVVVAALALLARTAARIEPVARQLAAAGAVAAGTFWFVTRACG